MLNVEPEEADLLVVTERREGRGAALKARRERIGIPVEELAGMVNLTREQLGKILNDKVPNSRAFGRIERVLDEIETEHGRGPTYTATTSGQVEIEAEGVFGVERIVVRGDPRDAEESFARLFDRLKRGGDPD